MPNSAFRRVGRPRGARSGVTRERIVSAASGVFGEVGYHATTFQAVAERAQVTRPAVNHYFPRKQLLYQEVLTQAAALLQIAVEEARSQRTLVGQLSSVVASFVRLAEENHTVAAFVVTAVVDAQRDPALRSLVGAIQLPTQSFLVEALSEAIERGELVTDSSVAELTEMLLAVLWGVTSYISLVGASPGVVGSFQALLAQDLWRLRQPVDRQG